MPAAGGAVMRWIRVYGESLQSDRRWIRLSMEERGAWISLAFFASSPEEPGALADRETAELLLRRDGATDPARLLDALLASGLVELVEEESAVAFTEAIDWTQRAPSDEPAATRERKRRERRRRQESRAVTSPVTTSHEPSRQIGEERREEKKRARARDGEPEAPSHGANGEERQSRDEMIAAARKLLADPTTADVAKIAARKALERLGEPEAEAS
jgi:hypothetical protein